MESYCAGGSDDVIASRDVTLDDTRKLEPFIKWLRLDKWYLSVAVKEISTVEYNKHSSRPIRNPEREMKNRAHGLLRIAIQNDSPRARSLQERVDLYRALRQAKVYETDKTSSELHLFQDNRDFKHIKNPSELHIRENEDGALKIFVPRDPELQDICYFEALPLHLLDWLMMNSETNVKARGSYAQALDVMNITINAPLRSLPHILVARGIVDTDVLEEGCDSDYGSDGGGD